MPNTSVQATGEALPADIEQPWMKARRLSAELSETLRDCDMGRWFAHVMPPTPISANGYGAFPMSLIEETSIDRINRLAWELSEALNKYQNGNFLAVVNPSSKAGHTVMLAATRTFDERNAR